MNDEGRRFSNEKPDESTPRSSSNGLGPYGVAPAEDLLYSLQADGSRKWIDPILVKGRYWRWRAVLGWFLITVFVGLPLVTIGGKPGIFQDIANRQFTFLGYTMQPTEPLILMSLGISIVVSVFVVTAVLGRAWCGYACPHPVYLEFVFRPIERLLEGQPGQRRRRDARGWTFDRMWRKGTKWTLYAVIATFLATTFVSYFVSWDGLLSGVFSDPLSHRGTLLALLGVSGLVFFNFAYFRDQMCTVACPYSRLQNALYDRDTVIVGYDTRRGEPRAQRAKGKDAPGLGDCVDCGLCVRVCPTGMDIRRGLQMECIGCAQCIEACDEVMLKVDKPVGLIRYTSLRELESGKQNFVRPRIFVYGALLLVAYGSLATLVALRTDADAEVLRSGREPYRILPTGEVANILRVRLVNKKNERQSFTVTLTEPESAELVVSRSPFPVEGNRVATVDVVAKLSPDAFVRGRVEGRFVIESDAGARIEEEFLLLGPYRRGK